MKTLLLTLFLFLLPSLATAQEAWQLSNSTAWIGTTSNNWATATNWSSGLPSGTRFAVIPPVGGQTCGCSDKTIADGSACASPKTVVCQTTSSFPCAINTTTSYSNDIRVFNKSGLGNGSFVIGANLTITGNLINNGAVTANSSLSVNGSVSGAGSTTINNNSDIYLKGNLTHTFGNLTAVGSNANRVVFSSYDTNKYNLNFTGTVDLSKVDFVDLNTNGVNITGTYTHFSNVGFYNGASGLTYLTLNNSTWNGKTLDGLFFSNNPANLTSKTVNFTSGTTGVTLTNFATGAAYKYGSFTSVGAVSWGTTEADLESLTSQTDASGLTTVVLRTASEFNTLAFIIQEEQGDYYSSVIAWQYGSGTTPIGNVYYFHFIRRPGFDYKLYELDYFGHMTYMGEL